MVALIIQVYNLYDKKMAYAGTPLPRRGAVVGRVGPGWAGVALELRRGPVPDGQAERRAFISRRLVKAMASAILRESIESSRSMPEIGFV